MMTYDWRTLYNCHDEVINKTPPPQPPSRPKINTAFLLPAWSKPYPPLLALQSAAPSLSFRSATAADFDSVLARRAAGCAQVLTVGLILGGTAGRGLTTVRWWLEFMTGYSENQVAKLISLGEKCLTSELFILSKISYILETYLKIRILP